ncbi:MAG: DUF21 domain-containing protein [Kouleothrix sp.]
MDPEFSLVIIGIALCLLVLAFTSAVDAALGAIGRHRLNLLQESRRRVQLWWRACSQIRTASRRRFLLANAASIITATACAQWLTRGLALEWRLAALAGLLLLILIFSEALPKALALRNPAAAAQSLARPMALLAGLLWPLISLLSLAVSPLVRALSGQATAKQPLVTEEELRLLVNVGEEEA